MGDGQHPAGGQRPGMMGQRPDGQQRPGGAAGGQQRPDGQRGPGGMRGDGQRPGGPNGGQRPGQRGGDATADRPPAAPKRKKTAGSRCGRGSGAPRRPNKPRVLLPVVYFRGGGGEGWSRGH